MNWKLLRQKITGEYAVGPEVGRQIATIIGCDSKAVGNGHLLSAAPELRESLKNLIAVLHLNDGGLERDEQQAVDAALSAIAKSEGNHE